MRKSTSLVALTVLLLGAGCASAPERLSADAVPLTERFAGPASSRAAELAAEVQAMDRQWWEYFESEELNNLVTTALSDNPGINQVRARLAQAAAAARQEFADLLPSASIAGARSTTNGDTETPSSFSLRGAASFELDIWGGNRANYQSGKLTAQAVAQDVRTAAITLSASIAENWLRLLALREEEALLRSQIKTNEMVLDLQQQRYESGIAQALDVLQQREVLARAKAQLPDVLAQQALVTNQIKLLAGGNPSLSLEISGKELPAPLPVAETGIPSGLLASRPDIQAAWLRLVSSDWAAEAARVNRLPAFDISATYTTTSPKFADTFETWLLNLALGLTMPIFAGGELAAQQAQVQALADERFQAYREVVLEAIGEVENSLVRNSYQLEQLKALDEQLQAARNSLEQAQASYAGGNTGYISVLTGLNSVQSLEQQMVRERLELALERVELYRALGPRTGD